MSRRLNALVIGNAAYEAVEELKNPVNDAEDVGAMLETCGFTVIRSLDSDHADMDRALKKFQRALKDSDVGLFFFAGHGMQIDGENYLAAVDTDGADEIAAKHSSLALNHVIEVMEKSGCSTSIIVLDACRNNPFERAWTRSMESRGLAPVYAPRGTLIAFATSPGQTASDGRGRNGAGRGLDGDPDEPGVCERFGSCPPALGVVVDGRSQSRDLAEQRVLRGRRGQGGYLRV